MGVKCFPTLKNESSTKVFGICINYWVKCLEHPVWVVKMDWSCRKQPGSSFLHGQMLFCAIVSSSLSSSFEPMWSRQSREYHSTYSAWVGPRCSLFFPAFSLSFFILFLYIFFFFLFLVMGGKAMSARRVTWPWWSLAGTKFRARNTHTPSLPARVISSSYNFFHQIFNHLCCQTGGEGEWIERRSPSSRTHYPDTEIKYGIPDLVLQYFE